MKKTVNEIAAYIVDGYIQTGYFEENVFYPVHYLLELYSNQDKTIKVIRLFNEMSTNTNRWNEFVVEENEVEDLENGIVSLDVSTYDYFVWQSKTNSMLLEDATGIVESGKCVVIGDKIVSSSFVDDRNEYTFR